MALPPQFLKNKKENAKLGFHGAHGKKVDSAAEDKKDGGKDDAQEIHKKSSKADKHKKAKKDFYKQLANKKG